MEANEEIDAAIRKYLQENLHLEVTLKKEPWAEENTFRVEVTLWDGEDVVTSSNDHYTVPVQRD